MHRHCMYDCDYIHVYMYTALQLYMHMHYKISPCYCAHGAHRLLQCESAHSHGMLASHKYNGFVLHVVCWQRQSGLLSTHSNNASQPSESMEIE